MPQKKRVKAAVMGSGRISKVYIPTIQNEFHILDLVGGWDFKMERAEENERRFGLPAMAREQIMADPSIEIILNLAQPQAHYEITREAMLAGKHVYSEKALACDMAEADELMALSREKNVLYTVAPDTFLGGGWQTARKLIDDGYIGKPLAVNAVLIRSYGLYDVLPNKRPLGMGRGGGIPYDMGGYYLHAMFLLFGGLSQVAGFMKLENPKRPFLNPRNLSYGETLEVYETASNSMTASLLFESGVYGSLTITSESDVLYQPRFEVYGTQGTLVLPDPNFFGGDICLLGNRADATFTDCLAQPAHIPSTHGYTAESRGIGAADMAYALRNARTPRADASLGYHAFEAIWGLQHACKEGKTYVMRSRIQRPAPIPPGIWRGGVQEAALDN